MPSIVVRDTQRRHAPETGRPRRGHFHRPVVIQLRRWMRPPRPRRCGAAVALRCEFCVVITSACLVLLPWRCHRRPRLLHRAAANLHPAAFRASCVCAQPARVSPWVRFRLLCRSGVLTRAAEIYAGLLKVRGRLAPPG
jgi:hypothetical protein